MSTLEFFASIGIPIHEGDGMTETTAFASVQPHGRLRFGTIGKPQPQGVPVTPWTGGQQPGAPGDGDDDDDDPRGNRQQERR